VVADVTYGKGIFWKNVPPGKYDVRATDIQTGVNCHDLPYADEAVDCVVLDPPYMEGLYRRVGSQMAGSGTHVTFRNAYSSGEPTPEEMAIRLRQESRFATLSVQEVHPGATGASSCYVDRHHLASSTPFHGRAIQFAGRDRRREKVREDLASEVDTNE
jgi:hypothetical protein